MSSRVAFISQKNYEIESLVSSIKRAIGLSGFDLGLVNGKKVMLKPNLLGAYPPEMAVTTHPNFVEAVAKIFIEAKANVSIGDSPNTVHAIDDTWKTTGMDDVCRRTGVRKVVIETSGNKDVNGVPISRSICDADFVINLPKFKTHGLTIMTLAVKNLFGCVNGMQKTRFHRDYKDPKSFAELIVKVANAVRPSLTIIDGIIGMDGNGPSGGNSKELGIIVSGTNIHAIDAACCKFVDLSPLSLDTLSAAKKFGLWNEKDEIEIVGDPFEQIKPSNFSMPITYTRGIRDWWITRLATHYIWTSLSAQPKINRKKCRICLKCIEACPVSTIKQFETKKPPTIIKKDCIQCMCCHEICPYKAIDLKLSTLIRIARWFVSP